jgi:lipopolysaccharide export system permease protein
LLGTAKSWVADGVLPPAPGLWLVHGACLLIALGLQSLRKQRENPLSYEVAFWRRVSAPVYMGVMVLLAVPMVLVGGRSVRLGERATLGALVGIGFQMFQEMFTNLGLVSGFPPVLIALGPAVVGLVSVSALFRWQRLR